MKVVIISPKEVWDLMIWSFDPKSTILWSPRLFRIQLLLTHIATTTVKIAFSVTNYWKLRNVISFFPLIEIFYQIKKLMFYNVQTTNVTFVSKISETQQIIIALHNSK